MADLYLDTSALLKRYRTEAGTAVVDDILDAAGPGQRLYTSSLTVVEVVSVLRRLARRGALTEPARAVIAARALEDLRSSVRTVDMAGPITSGAIDYADRHGLYAADAIHLATILHLAGESGRPYCLVTSDQDLARAGRREGARVLDPESPKAPQELEAIRAG